MNWLDDFDDLMQEKAAIVYHQHKPTDPVTEISFQLTCVENNTIFSTELRLKIIIYCDTVTVLLTKRKYFNSNPWAGRQWQLVGHACKSWAVIKASV